MLELFLKQLALIGALSALVLAVLWPHVKPILLALWVYLTTRIGRLLGHWNDAEDDDDDAPKGPIRRPIQDHPRLSGYSLRKSLPDVMVPKVSLAGYGHSPRSSLLVGGGAGIVETIYPQRALDKLLASHQGANLRSSDQGQSSIPLSLFTSAVMALVIFSFFKFASPASHKRRTRRSSQHQQRGDHGSRIKPSLDEDMRAEYHLNRRKWSKMNRDERARQLILRHGGKNVSKALRFLVAELERQKLEFIKRTNETTTETLETDEKADVDTCLACPCSCHEIGTTTNSFLANGNQRQDSSRVSLNEEGRHEEVD